MQVMSSCIKFLIYNIHYTDLGPGGAMRFKRAFKFELEGCILVIIYINLIKIHPHFDLL